jgi:hypothetical protein
VLLHPPASNAQRRGENGRRAGQQRCCAAAHVRRRPSDATRTCGVRRATCAMPQPPAWPARRTRRRQASTRACVRGARARSTPSCARA